jgi:hypothetical protein
MLTAVALVKTLKNKIYVAFMLQQYSTYYQEKQSGNAPLTVNTSIVSLFSSSLQLMLVLCEQR